jgi:tRNA(fMet)-specific endonuclease VapC
LTTYLLDTCAVSDFFRGIGDAAKHLKSIPPEQVALSSVTEMEVIYGFLLNPSAQRKFEQAFTGICSVATILPFDRDCARTAARIRAKLKIAGMTIGPWDLLIAATAVTHDCTLVTSNTAEFERIGELKLEKWR